MLAGQVIHDARDECRIDVGHLAHVGEFHQPIGGQHGLRRRFAKQAEATGLVRHLEGEQPLIAQVDQMVGLQLDARVGLAGALQVVQDQHVGIGCAAGLLEAAIRLMQQRVQPCHHLADDARVDLDA